MTTSRPDRALAALRGLALGDALGMPTQSMSPTEIERHYGHVDSLLDAADDQPIAPSMPAGSVTDDTEQAVLVGRLLVAGGGHLDPLTLATSLLAWEDDMIRRGSLDLLGPSTKSALERVRAGDDPRETGRFGATNGAAMRVTPIGIAYSLHLPDAFADAVHESCQVTHDTEQGWESAALVAAAVSAGIEGAGVREALETAVGVVGSLPRRGHWTGRASVLSRSREALSSAQRLNGPALERRLRTVVGTSVEATESIPAALCVALAYADDPFAGLCAAARLGGDTDTIAAMAGAVLGACHGTTAFPADSVATIERVSRLDLAPLAEQLLELRGR